MFDAKFVRNNIEAIEQMTARRGEPFSLDQFVQLDQENSRIRTRLEEIQHKINVVSKKIGRLKRENKESSSLQEEMKDVSAEIKDLKKKKVEVEASTQKSCLGYRISRTPRFRKGRAKKTIRK